MISTLFCKVINMGITGSIAILVVMLARKILRRQPKKYSYLLWLVVIFRLLCPVSISSALSLYSLVKPVSENASIEYFSPQELAPIVLETTEKVDGESDENVVIEVIERKVDYLSIAAFAWLAVGCGLMGKNIHTYLYLKRRLQNSRKTGANTYKNSYLSSAFVIGCLKPKIYLPDNISPNEEKIVVMHEQQHIKSGHTYAKLLAFTALCVHWFNPLVWLAYSLFEKDMEMACDEAVISQLGHKAKADYSQALLSISTNTGKTRYLRLAFGENEVKERVVNIMKFKNPSTAKYITLGLAVVAICTVLVLNPKTFANTDSQSTGTNGQAGTAPSDILVDNTDDVIVVRPNETPEPTPEVIIAAAIEPTDEPSEEPKAELDEKTAGETQRVDCYKETPEQTAESVQTTAPMADIDLSFTVDDLLGGDYYMTRGFTGQYADGGHDGLDFSAPYGTPIKALEDGVVIQAYYTSRGYGIYIAIDHGDYVTHYSHCSKLDENIQMGDSVKKGDVIAYVGSTGNSTGNHLHLEVRKKSDETGLSSGYTRVDPAKFMK